MINATGFSLGLALLVLAVKASSFLAPFNLYFSISTLVVGGSEVVTAWALLIKLVIPFVVGLLLTAPVVEFSRRPVVIHTQFGKALTTYTDGSAIITAQAVAFFGSLLLSWPMIVHWDILAAFEVREYRGVFMLAYFIYFASYALMAGAGARFGLILSGLKKKPSWMKSARDSLIGALMGGVATIFLGMFVRA